MRRRAEIGRAFLDDALEDVDFRPMLDKPLKEIREFVGLEVDLLKAYYAIEAKRYPDCEASQRLLS